MKLRCPNPATVECMRVDGSVVRLCDPCSIDLPDDVVATLPVVLGSRAPRVRRNSGTCEGEG